MSLRSSSLNVRSKKIQPIGSGLSAMSQEDTSPQKVTDVLSEPMTTAIKKISNEIFMDPFHQPSIGAETTLGATAAIWTVSFAVLASV